MRRKSLTCNSVSVWMSRSREEIHGKRRPAFQPGLHPDFLDSPPRVCEPRGQLGEIHAAVVGQVLLLGLGRVGIVLVLFDPFH